MLPLVACNHDNPNFDGSGEDTGGGGGEGGTSADTGSGSGPIATSGQGSGKESESQSGSDSGNSGPATADGGGPDDGPDSGDEDDSSDTEDDMLDSCSATLYGVSAEDGELYLINPTEPYVWIARPVVPASHAIATHPISGEIYLSPVDNPGTLHRLNPLNFEDDGELVVSLPPEATPPFFQAAWEENTVSVGTEEGWFSQVRLIEMIPDGIAQYSGEFMGGDVTFTPDGFALIATATGDVAEVDTFEIIETIVHEFEAPSFTGIAYDNFNGTYWVSTFGELSSDLYELSISDGKPELGDPVPLTDRLTDLAPIVELPDWCK